MTPSGIIVRRGRTCSAPGSPGWAERENMGIMEEMRKILCVETALKKKGYVFESVCDVDGYVYFCGKDGWREATRTWRDSVEVAAKHEKKVCGSV